MDIPDRPRERVAQLHDARAISFDGFKLIARNRMFGRGFDFSEQLFQLAEDGAELENLAQSRPKMVRALKQRLEQNQQESSFSGQPS